MGRAVDLPLGVLGACLLACAFAFAAWGIPPLPPGAMVALGVPSPLTGMTRSFTAVAGGDIAGSLRLHPLGPACFAVCVAAAASAAAVRVRGHRPAAVDRMLRWRWSPWIVAAAFAAAWPRQILTFWGS